MSHRVLTIINWNELGVEYNNSSIVEHKSPYVRTYLQPIWYLLVTAGQMPQAHWNFRVGQEYVIIDGIK